MRTYTLQTDDIDQFFSDQVEWQYDYRQLSAGPLKFRTRIVELPGITLYWNHFGARILAKEAYIGDELIFAIVFPAKKPFLYQGHEFTTNHAVIQQPDAEHNYVIPEGLSSLVIYVDRSLIAAVAPALSKAVEKRVHSPALMALVKVCQSSTKIIQRQTMTRNDETLAMTLRNRILNRLLEALTPWYAEKHETEDADFPCSKEFSLVNQAEEEMMKIGLPTRPSMDQLAGILEVSRRTLFYSFNQWLGVGPNAYFDIVRLHRVRDRLLAGTRSTTSVTVAANEMGFNHLGRFAGRYYEFFGEHPSETLTRGKNSKTGRTPFTA